MIWRRGSEASQVMPQAKLRAEATTKDSVQPVDAGYKRGVLAADVSGYHSEAGLGEAEDSGLMRT